jgi:hypothetical protein
LQVPDDRGMIVLLTVGGIGLLLLLSTLAFLAAKQPRVVMLMIKREYWKMIMRRNTVDISIALILREPSL